MKNNYLAPQIEVIEIEIEDAVLSESNPNPATATSVEAMIFGTTFGDEF